MEGGVEDMRERGGGRRRDRKERGRRRAGLERSGEGGRLEAATGDTLTT